MEETDLCLCLWCVVSSRYREHLENRSNLSTQLELKMHKIPKLQRLTSLLVYIFLTNQSNQPTKQLTDREPLRNICTLFIKSFSSLQLYVSKATLPPLPWMLGISICLTFQKLQISAVIIEDFHAKVKQVNIAANTENLPEEQTTQNPSSQGIEKCPGISLIESVWLLKDTQATWLVLLTGLFHL